MQCPTDGTLLTMSERNGIEIDYCPTCRGVWLDRGELDKILERSFSQPAAAAPAPPAPSWDGGQQSQHQPSQPQGHYKKKRKESWLSELFE